MDNLSLSELEDPSEGERNRDPITSTGGYFSGDTGKGIHPFSELSWKGDMPLLFVVLLSYEYFTACNIGIE